MDRELLFKRLGSERQIGTSAAEEDPDTLPRRTPDECGYSSADLEGALNVPVEDQ
jgi:hypothetical protein